MAKYNPNAERQGSQRAALRRMAKMYPDEYREVTELRAACGILYSLPVDQFDRLCVETLQDLVKEGICKRPQQISFNFYKR